MVKATPALTSSLETRTTVTYSKTQRGNLRQEHSRVKIESNDIDTNPGDVVEAKEPNSRRASSKARSEATGDDITRINPGAGCMMSFIS